MTTFIQPIGTSFPITFSNKKLDSFDLLEKIEFYTNIWSTFHQNIFDYLCSSQTHFLELL